MQRHRRFIAIAVVLAAIASLLAASAARAGHRSSVTISFMEAMSSGTQLPTLNDLTKNFESTHPGITVNLIAEPNYGVLQQKEEAAVAAGNPPTIGQAYENWAAAFADSKAIIPLTSYVSNKKTGVTPAAQKQFWTGVWKDLYLPDGK
ncbi:MAG: extracellular solute-binding protein, partial [Gaiellaceae bacterium]